MNQTDRKIDSIIRAFKLVPEFDGSPNALIRFLSLCDKLVIEYISTEPGNELPNAALINGILNKITGPAARTLATNGVPSDWSGIRTTLVNTFSDHRDETTLYSDLSHLTQGSDTPHVFYEKVQNLLSYIITYVELHETVETTIQSKRSLYKNLALKTYLKGLDEPLGSRIRCMRPPTIETALTYVQEEMNVLYMQRNLQRKPMPISATLPNNQIPSKPFTFERSFVPHMSRPKFGIPQPDMNRPRPIYQGPSRTQQMFRALPRSNMSTGFRIAPRQPVIQQFHNNRAQGPQPMSGISHPVARPLPLTRQFHDWRIHGNPPPNNYFKTREVNTNEIYEPTYDYEYDYYDSYYDQNEINNEYYDYEPVTIEETPTTACDESTSDQNFHKGQADNAPE